MSYEEKNTWVSLIANVLIVFYFANKVLAMQADGAFAGPDGLTVWAQTVLWMIPVSIMVTIVLTILFHILAAIASGGKDVDSTSDERDRRFSGRGMIGTVVVASAGLIAALVLLALGGEVFVALNIILFAFAAGSFLSDALRIFFYRRGY